MNAFLIRLVVVLTFCLSANSIFAEEWIVPDDKKQKVSSFKFSDETVKKGKEIYQKNCLSCHGEPTKANFSNLTPSPGDPASDKFKKQTDGALFYKITTGRGLMPEFKNVLTDDERWQVISYFRSFDKTYIQPEPVSAPTGVYGGMEISTSFQYNASKKVIVVKAIGKKAGVNVPIAGVEMLLYAKRYFGNIQIDEAKTTNTLGEAFFDYKDSIPGNKTGDLVFVVKLNAEGLSGFKQIDTLNIGIPTSKPSLIDTRAMWTVRSQAPIWLIAAYTVVVLVIWAFLFYIVSRILKIRKLGKQKE